MENKNQPQITEEEIIRAIASDCRQQAEAARVKLGEVIRELNSNNHLAAVGAFIGFDDEINCLALFLKRLARLVQAAPQ